MMRSSSKKPRIVNEDITRDGGFKIRTYRPTWDEMKNFSAFIKKIHDEGGNRPGLAKIIPPYDYNPRKSGYQDDTLYDMRITSPITQKIEGESGLYQQFNVVERKQMSVRNFKRLAEDKYSTPHHNSYADLERIFWKNIFTQPSIYGADVSGSLFDEDVEDFNLTKLNTILDDIRQDYGVTIQGVNTAYLYFGMWKTSFCWHTEDMDLYSINYLHDGAPKSWYCIAPEHGKRFERLAASFFPHTSRSCKAFLRHKTTLISPAILKKYSIPFSRCTQEKGEFMITFPFSYHSGYNHGFNIAEATNFALEYWVDFGKWTTRCECSPDVVRISMQTYVKKYQSERYDLWLRGKDICKDPRDPKHTAAAPKPNEYDLYFIGSHEKQTLQEEEELEKSKKNALQQNQSSNVKARSKAKKSGPTLEETYQRYNDFLSQNDQNNYASNITLPHFSPIPDQMALVDLTDTSHIPPTGSYSFVPRNAQPYLGCNQNTAIGVTRTKKPNYDRQIKETLRAEAKKRKKEEKARSRKEKRAKDSIIPSNQLLQYLPLTFTHEKRFNRCIAAMPPHCSVCQLLECHPRDNEDIWGNNTNTIPHEEKSALNSQTSTAILTPTPSSNELLLTTELTIQTISPTTAGTQVEEFKLPNSSSILLPSALFSNYPKVSKFHEEFVEAKEEEALQSTESELINDRGEDDQEVGEALDFVDMSLGTDLLRCVVCMLCVHKKCYGLENTQISNSDWRCDRCMEPNRSLINCELCPCRGGALKRINTSWVHLTCALTVPDVKFIDLIRPDLITSTKSKLDSSTAERNLCSYCVSSSSIVKYVQGRCIGCVDCPITFHPTCGHRNGVKFIFFDLNNDPDMKCPVRGLCPDCQLKPKFNKISQTQDDENLKKEELAELALEKIPQGTSVIALSSDKFYRDGMIDSYRRLTLYDVYFPQDSTVETHIRPERIVEFDPDKNYMIGDELEIKVDNQVFAAKYKGSRQQDEYKVKFGNRTEEVSRKNIYHHLDQMSAELFNRYKSSTNRVANQIVTEHANDHHLDVD